MPPSSHPTARDFVRYWRRSLADADLQSPSLKEPLELSPSALLSGQLEPAERADAFRRVRKGKSRQKEAEQDEIQVLVTPFRLRRRTSHGARRGPQAAAMAPLWIGARLDASGQLRGDPRVGLWIARRHLSPTADDRAALGLVHAFDTFLTRHPLPEDDTWRAYYEYASKLLKAVTGCSLEGFHLEDHETLPPALVGSVGRGLSASIRGLYDRLLDGDGPPALLSRLALGTETPAPAPAPFPTDTPEVARRHLGQMGNAFPLGPAQRQVLHTLATLEDGEVLAVNGPPGTGKTTVLQSVVATLWVEAALAAERPPLVLACAATNRAVTNILDSFKRGNSPSGPDADLGRRWLPEVSSYGLYFPARRHDPRNSPAPYQEASPGKPWQGLPAVLENRDFVDRGRETYLDNARRALDPTLDSVADTVDRLHDELKTTHDQVLGAVNLALELPERRRRGDAASHQEAGRRLERHRAAAEHELQKLDALRRDAYEALRALPWWIPLLSFLPTVRRHRAELLEIPFRQRGHAPPRFGEEGLARTLSRHFESLEQPHRSRLAELEQWRLREEALERLAGEIAEGKVEAELLDNPRRLLEHLDTTLRYRLFQLTARYWEGRWLLEMHRLFEDKANLSAQSRRACIERLQRFAMLTPCFVATFFRAPKVFDCFEKGAPAPLLESMDLLLVDEAGQVTPESGAATFALARRALVVGDIHQIEPVWSITPGIDQGNLAATGLPTEAPETYGDKAHRASCGSIMLLARRATARGTDEDRGLFLAEHRRSIPRIIEYCNRLVYRGRLEPLREDVPSRSFPALGWAHILSPSERRGGSRVNTGEAQAIADWLAKNRTLIEKGWHLPIAEAVAVITPFAAQADALRTAFRDAGLRDLTAGTVHTFQGGERPLVLFSSVYSNSDPPPYFFDAGPNLLNVAVSRARDSFLLFGDQRIFQPGQETPSGLLAQRLYAEPDNEITDVESAQRLRTRGSTRRIDTLEGHRNTLDRAFTESRRRVLVVSPYLSTYAIEADAVEENIRQARARGVKVTVAFDGALSGFDKQRDNAVQAVQRLQDAGAQVLPCKRMHNKTLACDNLWIVEGSFNWLSARRDEDHRFQRHEVSLRYDGDGTSKLVDDAWSEVETAKA